MPEPFEEPFELPAPAAPDDAAVPLGPPFRNLISGTCGLTAFQTFDDTDMMLVSE